MTEPYLILHKDKERFLAKVNQSESGCWTFLASTNDQGYGWFWFRGKMWLAHRASYVIHKGEIPFDKCVLHTCDNSKCVNPGHLYLGTKKDNSDDMDAKGHRVSNKGELNASSILTENDVIQIRQHLGWGLLSLKEIGEMFSVSKGTISNIKARRTWSHV